MDASGGGLKANRIMRSLLVVHFAVASTSNSIVKMCTCRQVHVLVQMHG